MMLVMLVFVPRTTIAQETSAIAGATTRSSRPRVVVRLYGSAQPETSAAADGEVLSAAVQDTVEILRAAGVDLEIQSCEHWRAGDENDPCERPLGSGEFSIRTYRSSLFSPAAIGEQRQLAYSLLDVFSGQGSLITIDLSAVEWLADASGSKRGLLLGRVIAHEVGHLLLRSPDHTRSGLMRAVWTNRELRRRRAEDWVFTAPEVLDIHAQRSPGSGTPVESAALVGQATQ